MFSCNCLLCDTLIDKKFPRKHRKIITHYAANNNENQIYVALINNTDSSHITYESSNHLQNMPGKWFCIHQIYYVTYTGLEKEVNHWFSKSWIKWVSGWSSISRQFINNSKPSLAIFLQTRMNVYLWKNNNMTNLYHNT